MKDEWTPSAAGRRMKNIHRRDNEWNIIWWMDETHVSVSGGGGGGFASRRWCRARHNLRGEAVVPRAAWCWARCSLSEAMSKRTEFSRSAHFAKERSTFTVQLLFEASHEVVLAWLGLIIQTHRIDWALSVWIRASGFALRASFVEVFSVVWLLFSCSHIQANWIVVSTVVWVQTWFCSAWALSLRLEDCLFIVSQIQYRRGVVSISVQLYNHVRYSLCNLMF